MKKLTMQTTTRFTNIEMISQLEKLLSPSIIIKTTQHKQLKMLQADMQLVTLAQIIYMHQMLHVQLI